jgi:hypothetical protein
MSRSLSIVFFAIAAWIVAPLAFGQDDVEGSKDYPGISRMPGYFISGYRGAPFDAYEFRIAAMDSWEEKTVEGHRYDIRYNLKDNAQAPAGGACRDLDQINLPPTNSSPRTWVKRDSTRIRIERKPSDRTAFDMP